MSRKFLVKCMSMYFSFTVTVVVGQTQFQVDKKNKFKKLGAYEAFLKMGIVTAP